MDINQFFTSHAVDIFAAMIFLVTMLIGAKRGFLRTLSEFVCGLIAFTAAKLLATPAAMLLLFATLFIIKRKQKAS